MRRLMAGSLALSVTVLGVISVAACSGGEIAVGKTDQSGLQLKKDGTATGNGSTCSWAGTTAYDASGSNTSAATNYVVGDNFQSLDGCNDCSCTTKGIMCTLRTCGGSSSGSSGTSSGNGGADGGQACTDEAKQCPDGSYVGRTGPNCEFAPCPTGTACPAIAKLCPDGSSVSPQGPNCVIPACPPQTCAQLTTSAEDQVAKAIQNDTSCNVDTDCTNVSYSSQCFDGCTRALNAQGQTDFANAVALVNGSQCQQFAAQNCTVIAPPCASPQAPKCVNHGCQ